MVEFVKATTEQLEEFKFEGEVKIKSFAMDKTIEFVDSKEHILKVGLGSYGSVEVFIEKPLEKKIKYELVGKLLGGMIEYKEIINNEYDALKLKNDIMEKDSLADIKINEIEVME